MHNNNFETKKRILDKIKEYDKIFIFRHKRPDGDATGSTKGLQRILKLSFPEKKILLQNSDFAEYMAFLGNEDELLPDEEYADALGIVIDTGTMERVSNQKFTLCKEIIKSTTTLISLHTEILCGLRRNVRLHAR